MLGPQRQTILKDRNFESNAEKKNTVKSSSKAVWWFWIIYCKNKELSTVFKNSEVFLLSSLKSEHYHLIQLRNEVLAQYIKVHLKNALEKWTEFEKPRILWNGTVWRRDSFKTQNLIRIYFEVLRNLFHGIKFQATLILEIRSSCKISRNITVAQPQPTFTCSKSRIEQCLKSVQRNL